MIRVIYRWRVEPQNFDAFRNTWRETTNHIHDTVPGARGSFLLRSQDDGSSVLTIAKWDSMESWQRFFGEQNPAQMAAMRALGERVSVRAFEEVEDQTQ